MKASQLIGINSLQPVQLNPAYINNLVKEVILSADAQDIDFTGLNIDQDEGYFLELYAYGSTAGTAVGIYFNNDTADTYYNTQQIYGENSALNTAEQTYGYVAYMEAGGRTYSRMDITSVNGYPIVKSDNLRLTSTGDIKQNNLNISYNVQGTVTAIKLRARDTDYVFKAGTIARLFKKRLNPSLLVTNNFLSNLIEERLIQNDTSQVDFYGLDSSLDGDYLLQYNLLNGPSNNYFNILFNGDTVVTDYRYRNIVNDTMIDSSSYLIYLYANKHGSGTADLRHVGGYAYSTAISSRQNSADISLIGVVTEKKTPISSITSIHVRDALQSNNIKAGSVLRLYKTRSGSQRPGPSFSAHKNSVAQPSVVTETYTKVTLSEEWDSHDCFTDSKFTPSIAGRYRFTAEVYFSPGVAAAAFFAVLYKNGVAYKRGQTVRFVGTLGQGCSLNVTAEANGSTDNFELYVFHSAGTDLTISGDPTVTYFQASKEG